MLPQHLNPFAVPVEKSAIAPTFPPDGTTATGIRDATRKVRRAGLTRVVKGVVVASVMLCVAALARIAVAKVSGDPPEVSHGARVSIMKGPEVVSSFRTIHTDRALAHRARPGKRHPRATASR